MATTEQEIETRLADGRRSILGGDTINYTDITFAAFGGLWLQPGGYAGGQGGRSFGRAQFGIFDPGAVGGQVTDGDPGFVRIGFPLGDVVTGRLVDMQPPGVHSQQQCHATD